MNLDYNGRGDVTSGIPLAIIILNTYKLINYLVDYFSDVFANDANSLPHILPMLKSSKTTDTENLLKTR